jgi:hypothetical protein
MSTAGGDSARSQIPLEMERRVALRRERDRERVQQAV